MSEKAVQQAIDEKVIQKDNENWLFSGINGLSLNFEKLVPRHIRNEYVERLRKEGQFNTTFQKMEAMRAFQLYFITMALNEQISASLLSGALFKLAKEEGVTYKIPSNTMAQITRHYSESTAKLNKVLSEVMEKNGFSIVAAEGIGKTGDDPLSKIAEEMQNDDTEEFDLAFSIHKKKSKKIEDNPDQTNLLQGEDAPELTEAEYEEIYTPVNE